MIQSDLSKGRIEVVSRKSILAAILACIITTSCTYSGKDLTPDRHPDNAVQSGLKNLQSTIFTTVISLTNVPVSFVKRIVIKAAIKDYIKDLPLDRSARKRLLEEVDDERFMKKIVPFVWHLKEQYSLSESNEVESFSSHMRRHFRNRMVPGSDHRLFQWIPEKKASNGLGLTLSADVIAKILEIYDLVFVRGRFAFADSTVLTEPFQRVQINDMELIEELKPRVRDLLMDLVKPAGQGEKSGGANDGVIAALADVLMDEKRFEALTISMVDFIAGMAHKSSRIFATRYIYQKDLKSWMRAALDKDPQALYNFARFNVTDKRYAVQVVVDGLQKELLKGLQSRDRVTHYIRKVGKEVEMLYRAVPSNEKTERPENQPSHEFLNLIGEVPFDNELYLPFFRKLFMQYPQTIAENGISTTPTISVRNLPLAFTGASVAGKSSTGLPNFHFIDRDKDRAYYFYGNDALLLDDLTRESGMKTMFERLKMYNTMNCNAQYDFHSNHAYEGFVNLALGEMIRDFGERLCVQNLRKRIDNEISLRQLYKELADESLKYKSSSMVTGWIHKRAIHRLIRKISNVAIDAMPAYLLIYNPWPDHFAHFYGPFSDEIISPTGELNRLDYWLGKIEAIYQKAGIYDQTLWGMAGDHGLSYVFHYLNPEKQVIERFVERTGRQVLVKKLSSDEGEGPKLNHSVQPESSKGVDVLIASTAGGNFMFDFFRDQDKNWKKQPVYYHLTQLPLLSDGKPVNWIEEIKESLKETLDYMVVRETHSDPEFANVRVIGPRRGQYWSEQIVREGDKIYYKPSQGDLLGVRKPPQTYKLWTNHDEDDHRYLYSKCVRKAKRKTVSTWCDESDWRKLTNLTDRPDSVVQLAHIYDTDRAGTINLFPRNGIGYNTKVPGRHAGETFHEKDAFVGFWGAPLRYSSDQLDSAVVGSLAPTLYEYLTGEDAQESQGWGYPSVLKWDH